MKYLAALLALFLLAALALGALATWRAVEVSHVEAMAPRSAADLILESRQTPPAETGSGGGVWGALGLLAVVAMAMTGIIYLMRSGADLTKQVRLLRRKPQRRPRPGQPYAPPVPRIHEVPRQAPQLGPGAQEGRYEEVRH